MGIVLDTTVLVAAERSRRTVEALIADLVQRHGDTPAVISAISVIEFTHGIVRAQSETESQRRRAFATALYSAFAVQPVTFEIALIAGQIEGEQAALGNVLPFEDLIIASTALSLDFAVLTSNTRHFHRIPDLRVLTP